MDLPEFLAILVAFFFGVIAIIFSLREEKYKKQLQEQPPTKPVDHSLSFLKHFPQTINETTSTTNIGNTKIFTAITNTLHHLFPSSHIASLRLHDHTLLFTLSSYTPAGSLYVEELKKSMRASLEAIVGTSIALPQQTEDSIEGVPLTDTNHTKPVSFFHIPLITEDKVLGIITVSSSTPHAYNEDEVTTAYRMSHHASHALLSVNQAIEKEKDKLDSIVQNLNEGICLLDTNKQIMLINDAAKIFLGISQGNPTLSDIIHASPSLLNLQTEIDTLLTRNTPIAPKEITLRNGSFLLSAIPIKKDTTITGIMLTLRDITSDKTYWQMREDFTHMIIHEMRAPLTAIKAGVSLLKNPETITQEEQKKMADVISQQTEKLLGEINSLLDAAKIEKGPFVISKTPGNLQQTIQKAIDLFTAEIQEKKITLTSRIDTTIPTMFFDPAAIEKIINNLVSNSIKFTPSGGTIRIEGTYNASQHTVTIRVIDTGCGIDEEKKKKVFERFFQGTTGEDMEGKIIPGTGLGLYITKGLVEAHQGTISLESESGKGTTVTISLPVS